MDIQIKKGLLEIGILQLLSTQSMHGYQIMKQLSDYFEVNESGIYALLRRLSSEGYLLITLSNDSLGPVRKVYSISENGKIYLEEQCNELRKVLTALSTLGVKL